MGFCPCIPCIGRLRTGCMGNFSLWLLGLIVWRACCRRGFEPQQHATLSDLFFVTKQGSVGLTNGCAWNAVSAFANCGRAVAHVRGSYVPQAEVFA